MTRMKRRDRFQGRVFIPLFRHSAIGADAKPWGGCKAIFISFFISGIGVIRGCSAPYFGCG